MRLDESRQVEFRPSERRVTVYKHATPNQDEAHLDYPADFRNRTPRKRFILSTAPTYHGPGVFNPLKIDLLNDALASDCEPVKTGACIQCRFHQESLDYLVEANTDGLNEGGNYVTRRSDVFIYTGERHRPGEQIL